jgi:hypothetical protein
MLRDQGGMATMQQVLATIHACNPVVLPQYLRRINHQPGNNVVQQTATVMYELRQPAPKRKGRDTEAASSSVDPESKSQPPNASPRAKKPKTAPATSAAASAAQATATTGVMLTVNVAANHPTPAAPPPRTPVIDVTDDLPRPRLHAIEAPRRPAVTPQAPATAVVDAVDWNRVRFVLKTEFR